MGLAKWVDMYEAAPFLVLSHITMHMTRRCGICMSQMDIESYDIQNCAPCSQVDK
jgi:hypothetical protein